MSAFLSTLSKFSAAEEFLDFMGISYDPKVVSVNRLHILKRFHDYLGRAGAETQGADDETLRAVYHRLLEKAYVDFTTSDGVTEKVFKVFRNAQGTGFVPLSQVARKS